MSSLPRLSAVVTIVVASTIAPRVGASEVSYRPLEEVIDQAGAVFTAKVVSVRSADTPSKLTRTYELEDVKPLRGAPGARSVLYTQVIPIMRDSQGREVGHFSPVLDASGSEMTVRAGDRPCFFARAGGGDPPLVVFRIEPASRLGAVEMALARARPGEPGSDAGVAPRPATTAPPEPHASSSPSPSISPAATRPTALPSPRPARSGCEAAPAVAPPPCTALLVVVALLLLGRRRGAGVRPAASA